VLVNRFPADPPGISIPDPVGEKLVGSTTGTIAEPDSRYDPIAIEFRKYPYDNARVQPMASLPRHIDDDAVLIIHVMDNLAEWKHVAAGSGCDWCVVASQPPTRKRFLL
jgi:hypothetical protein